MGILGNIAAVLFMVVVITFLFIFFCMILLAVLATIVDAVYEATGKLKVLNDILQGLF